MKQTAIRLALTVCLIGFATSTELPGLKDPPLNYKGYARRFCPADKYSKQQPKNRVDTTMRLKLLRAEMKRITTVEGPPLDAYIVTSDDEHQSGRYIANYRESLVERVESETVHEHDRRREYISGFTGSAGDAVITLNKAVLWTDGRYHLQAEEQLDCKWTIMAEGRDDVPTIPQWLINEFNGQRVRIGANPKLVPGFRWKLLQNYFANTSISLVPVYENLVDNIWIVDRKSYNRDMAFALEDKYSGKPWQEKIKQVRLEMYLASADALVITALDEIAWLFNIRGSDLPYTPVLRAYAIITHGSIHLYSPRNKLKRSAEIHLKMDSCFHADCVKWHNYTSFWHDFQTMSQAWNTVWLPTRCGNAPGASAEIFLAIPSGKQLLEPSPVIQLRAEKNEIEAQGMRNAHIRDAIAMCDCISYIEDQMKYDPEGWDERHIVRLVEEFRHEQNLSRGLAFPTIAGYGPNGALPHYEPPNLNSLPIGKNSTLVLDSGEQYDDGTTDVTRTLHFGEPTQEQKEAYTRVLIGAIQLSSLIFPDNLRTDQFDVLARAALWKIGKDYMHATSHGIGHFLSVHEPPISISYKGGTKTPSDCDNVCLKPGFFLSNEPGYYKEYDFGVRLENVMEVVPANEPNQRYNNFLKFRQVTLVPYEPKLMDVDMLSPAHRRWLNEYNRRIRQEVGGELIKHLKMRAYDWLEKKTRVIPERGPVNMEFFLASHSNSFNCKNTHQILLCVFLLHLYTSLTSIFGY